MGSQEFLFSSDSPQKLEIDNPSLRVTPVQQCKCHTSEQTSVFSLLMSHLEYKNCQPREYALFKVHLYVFCFFNFNSLQKVEIIVATIIHTPTNSDKLSTSESHIGTGILFLWESFLFHLSS